MKDSLRVVFLFLEVLNLIKWLRLQSSVSIVLTKKILWLEMEKHLTENKDLFVKPVQNQE